MSRLLLILFSLAAILAMVGCSHDSALPTQQSTADLSARTAIDAGTAGNGAPNGAHYNLNIIGVPKSKTAPMDANDGHRIFVGLTGNTKIWLAEGDQFAVLDANGTDGNGAKFQLPDPDPDNDLVTRYSVYARALGKPGGSSQMTTCFVDEFGDTYCSLDTLTLTRGSGAQAFENVSKELLTMTVDLDGDGVTEQVGLFDNKLYDYYWSYDNAGLKLAQLRFYAVPTNVAP